MEISHYSDTDGAITIDKVNLYPYSIPHTNNSSNCPYGLNTLLGYKHYKPKQFSTPTSTIQPFLTALDALSLDLTPYSLICPSSLYQYIIISKSSTFNVIRKGSLTIVYNTDTRANQDIKISYVGIRFEDLLLHGPRHKTLNNKSNYYSVIERPIGSARTLYYSEIDSIDAQTSTYTEIKMILCKGAALPHARLTNKRKVLQLINNGNSYFHQFLFKLAVQCKYSLIDSVLIGVRDNAFNIRNINIYSIQKDILPYLKSVSPTYYERYINGDKLVQQIIEKLISDKTITSIKISQTDIVFAQ